MPTVAAGAVKCRISRPCTAASHYVGSAFALVTSPFVCARSCGETRRVLLPGTTGSLRYQLLRNTRSKSGGVLSLSPERARRCELNCIRLKRIAVPRGTSDALAQLLATGVCDMLHARNNTSDRLGRENLRCVFGQARPRTRRSSSRIPNTHPERQAPSEASVEREPASISKRSEASVLGPAHGEIPRTNPGDE
jgi:hypothetical protein